MRERPLVLLIDDEEIFLEIAATKLRAEGVDTVQTHSVEEAVEKTMSLEPDLVLSDISMAPGPSGWDLALQLRRNTKTKNVKIAFFTSLRDPWMELKSLDKERVLAEIGQVNFFSKTDDVGVLGKLVHTLLSS
jgi:CheY-like chemotaxis protein